MVLTHLIRMEASGMVNGAVTDWGRPLVICAEAKTKKRWIVRSTLISLSISRFKVLAGLLPTRYPHEPVGKTSARLRFRR